VGSVQSLRSASTGRRDTIHPQRNSLWSMGDENEPSPLRRMTISAGNRLRPKISNPAIISRRNTAGG